MKILIVCSEGRNRSKYLYDYLQQKGFEVDYGGAKLNALNPLKQEQVDWADVVITVEEPVKIEFMNKYSYSGTIIELEVSDNPIPKGLSWREFNETIVHPELERQIKRKLSLDKCA